MTIAATVATVSTANFCRCRKTGAKNNAQPTLHRCQLTAGYPTLSLPRDSVGSDSALLRFAPLTTRLTTVG